MYFHHQRLSLAHMEWEESSHLWGQGIGLHIIFWSPFVYIYFVNSLLFSVITTSHLLYCHRIVWCGPSQHLVPFCNFIHQWNPGWMFLIKKKKKKYSPFLSFSSPSVTSVFYQWNQVRDTCIFTCLSCLLYCLSLYLHAW